MTCSHPKKQHLILLSLTAMDVVPALDEIEDGGAGFGVRLKGVAADEFAVGLSAEIPSGLTNSSSSARRMGGRSEPSS